jgi:hypothetical protein
MRHAIKRAMAVAAAFLLVLPTVGCQPAHEKQEDQKAVDIQVDAGKTKVKVERSATPNKNGKRVDVEVKRPSGQESGDKGK